MPLPLYQNQSRQGGKKKDFFVPEFNGLSEVKATIGIAAGKGGVGKSSITVNLAQALTSSGFRVGILDADIYGPSIRHMLIESRLPVQKGNFIEPAICDGIKMISQAYFRKENEASAVRAPIAVGLISHFIKNILWGELDFLLIDFPPGTGDIQLTLTQQIRLSGAVMVTTPQEVSLLDVRKAMSRFNQVNVPIIGVVENMSYYESETSGDKVYIFGEGGGKRLSSETGSPFLGQIPLDPEICKCGDIGRSLFASDPESLRTTTRAFHRIAKEVIAFVDPGNARRAPGPGRIHLVWQEMEDR